MFPLVSIRHIGAHPDEHQHGVSIQISLNLGKTFLRISYTKYSSDLNLGEGLCIFTSFHFPDSGLYLLNGFDFYFDLFWMAWHWKPAINNMGERKNGSETGLSEGNTLPLTSRAFFFLAPMLLTSVCYARLSLQPWVFRCARGTPHPAGDWGSCYASYLKLTRSWMGPFDILSRMGIRENI